MLLDTITNQWFWLGAAGFFIILLGLLRLRHNVRRSTFQEIVQNQKNGWAPTGRIDFSGSTDSEPNSFGTFLLQAEDTRIVNSIGGVDRHEIRWRRATLNEAKKVVLTYHAQLNLATTAALVVSSPSSDTAKSELGNERQDTVRYKRGAATDDKAQG
jgi:hypothetical protein